MSVEVKDIVFHEIASLDDPAFPKVLRLYDEAFSQEIKQDRNVFSRLLTLRENSAFSKVNIFHLCLLEYGAQPVGMASFNYLRDIQAGFLGYIAVVKDKRGFGWGRLLMELCRRQVIEDALRSSGSRPEGIFAEIEKPELANDKEERHRRENRTNYFRNLGFQVFDKINYVQPAMIAGQVDVPLHLIFLPLGSASLVFSKKRWAETIRSIYANIYKMENVLSDEAAEGYIAKVLASF